MKIHISKIKRLITIVAIALCLVVAMQTIAFAAEPTVSIYSKQISDNTRGITGKIGSVTGSNVNLRKGPGLSYSSYGYVQSGDTFQVLAEPSGPTDGYIWIYVKMTSGSHSGKSGWIVRNYISIP